MRLREINFGGSISHTGKQAQETINLYERSEKVDKEQKPNKLESNKMRPETECDMPTEDSP